MCANFLHLASCIHLRNWIKAENQFVRKKLVSTSFNVGALDCKFNLMGKAARIVIATLFSHNCSWKKKKGRSCKSEMTLMKQYKLIADTSQNKISRRTDASSSLQRKTSGQTIAYRCEEWSLFDFHKLSRWLNGLFFGGVDGSFLKEVVKTYLMAPMPPL